jgi:hypothetical protein
MSQEDVRSAIDTTHANTSYSKDMFMSVISTCQTTVSIASQHAHTSATRLTNLVAKLPEHERGYWEYIVPSEFCAIFSDDSIGVWWRMANLFHMPDCRIFAIAMIPR